jgi:hypothetical protein
MLLSVKVFSPYSKFSDCFALAFAFAIASLKTGSSLVEGEKVFGEFVQDIKTTMKSLCFKTFYSGNE